MKSHAIPEAFFRQLRDGPHAPILVSNVANTWPARAPIGVYDNDVLCDGCEPKFGPSDAYGAEVLINRLDELFQPVVADGRIVAYFGQGVDQLRLKLFFLSVLWRAAISKHGFYDRMKLGPHLDRIRAVLDSPHNIHPDEYSGLMSRWIASPNKEAFADGLMSPILEKWHGINAVRMYFGKVVAYIKVDKRPFPEHIRGFVLGAHTSAVQIAREFDSSKDFAAMMNVAKTSLFKRS